MSKDKAISYVDLDGEWRTRSISLFGVVRSFVTQLRVGQDMTRISLPATLLYPFSMLEVFSARELGIFHLLFPLNQEEDPLERFLHVARWTLGFLQNESWHKKPYNPVLGEVLLTHNVTDQSGKSQFVAEQVSHHPPISAFNIYNEEEDLSLTANLSFGVQFGGNSVAITTEGSGVIKVNKRNETYELVKKTPGMTIKNVVWGTRKMFWLGDALIRCPETGLSLSMSFKDEGNDNTVVGTIYKGEGEDQEEVARLSGKCGGEVFVTYSKTDEKKLLINAGKIEKPKTVYGKWEDLDEMSSQKVWESVNEPSIIDDMYNADISKKRIEQEQRERSALKKEKGEENAARFFEKSEDNFWVFKDEKKRSSKK